MKILLDIDNHDKTIKNDILIYDGKIWSTISKDAFLRDLIVSVNNLKENLKDAFNRIENLENQLKIDHGEVEENELE